MFSIRDGHKTHETEHIMFKKIRPCMSLRIKESLTIRRQGGGLIKYKFS